MAQKIVGNLEINTTHEKMVGVEGWRCHVFLHRLGESDYIPGFNGRSSVHSDIRNAEAEAIALGEQMAVDYLAIQNGISESSPLGA